MKVLIYNPRKSIHHKILKNLVKSLELNGVVVSQQVNLNNIEDYDVVYSCTETLSIMDKYPNKKFIFGPQLGVTPRDVTFIGGISNVINAVFIQPSDWCVKLWVGLGWNLMPIKCYPVGIDTDLFKPSNGKIFIDGLVPSIIVYIKHREKSDIKFVMDYMSNFNYNINIFEYGYYDECNYLAALQKSKFGIWIDAHESQGFATQEALSCNVPLLVWSVKSIDQEVGCNWSKDIPVAIKNLATSVPYWDDRCGEVFYKKDEFEETLKRFISKLSMYKPREFILENLSLKKQGKEFINL